jgi:hypothetical protein
MTITEQKRLLEKALDRQAAVRDVSIRMGFPAKLVVTVEPGADVKAVTAAIGSIQTENPVELEIGGSRHAMAL